MKEIIESIVLGLGTGIILVPILVLFCFLFPSVKGNSDWAGPR